MNNLEGVIERQGSGMGGDIDITLRMQLVLRLIDLIAMRGSDVRKWDRCCKWNRTFLII